MQADTQDVLELEDLTANTLWPPSSRGVLLHLPSPTSEINFLRGDIRDNCLNALPSPTPLPCSCIAKIKSNYISALKAVSLTQSHRPLLLWSPSPDIIHQFSQRALQGHLLQYPTTTTPPLDLPLPYCYIEKKQIYATTFQLQQSSPLIY